MLAFGFQPIRLKYAIFSFESNKVCLRRLRHDLSTQMPSLLGRKRRQMPGVCPGGMFKLRLDWYITSIKWLLRQRTTHGFCWRGTGNEWFAILENTQKSFFSQQFMMEEKEEVRDAEVQVLKKFLDASKTKNIIA